MEVTIVSAVVLVLIIVGVFCYYKFAVPKSEDKDKAKEFIEGFTSVFNNTIENIIDDIDITSYTSLEDLETDIFKIAYEECWDYVESAVQLALSNNSITSLIAKCITQENVETIVQSLINTAFVSSVEAKFEANWNDNTDAIEAAEAEAQKEADLYESEEKVVDEYVEPEVEEPTETIIPPREDEEEPYDPETMEIVEDSTVDITDAIESDADNTVFVEY